MDSLRPNPNRVRLQKHLARCGFGSRRACETLIAAGLVRVNQQVVTRQGLCVDPERDIVDVDGQAPVRETHVYLLFNKPRDVLCTCRDPRNRRTFREFVREADTRLYPAGRLDRDSEGLLVLTNDGDFAHVLMHPRHKLPKTYHVWTSATLSPEAEQTLRRGVESEGERLSLDELTRQVAEDGRAFYEVVLHSGRRRQIRRMFAAVGLDVQRLKRVSLGPLRMKGLRVGQWRPLAPAEVRSLRQAANAAGTPGPASRQTREKPRFPA